MKKVHDSSRLDVGPIGGIKAPIKKITKTYYKCNQCKKKILKSSLLVHLNNIHDFHPSCVDNLNEFYFTEIQTSQNRVIKDPVKISFEKTYRSLIGLNHKSKVECHKCRLNVRKNSVVNHFKSNHGLDCEDVKYKIDKSLKKKVDRAVFERSVDIFDRLVKVNGGAYGLGKNRKN